MEKIKKLLKNPLIGIDAWYDSYIDDAVELFKIEIDNGKIEECFELLEELSKEEKVRFFEAIAEVQHMSLIPYFFNTLDNADIEVAEAIIDGLRTWILKGQELQELKSYALKYKGKSTVFDKVISSIIEN